jgi:hypothetical protein
MRTLALFFKNYRTIIVLLGILITPSIQHVSAQALGHAASFSDAGSPDLQSGFYQSYQVVPGFPDPAAGWVHMVTVRHSNTNNNHQMQIASSYPSNDRLFFRKVASYNISSPANPPWIELATRGTNLFSGDQSINGNLAVGINLPEVATGSGHRLSFLGASENSDPLWISRYNTAANSSELRVNIGDDVGQWQDMFSIGTVHHGDGQWHPHFSVQATGNVGIGTISSADAKLTVAGDIHAREVEVTVNAGQGPDYVFEKEYDLLSLSGLETYINQNKHLPEVPSAKEMEAEGLNLKEMNLLLLKKVEELTLHLIEQNKKNVLQSADLENQAATIQEQRKRIDKLEAQVIQIIDHK